MNSFTDTEIDTLEIPKKEEEKTAIKAAEENIVCLLYTSPSPRDDELSRMPSSA